MKLIDVLQFSLVQLVFFAMSEVSDEDSEKKDRTYFALISSIFMTWNLWRTIRKWGLRKIRVQSPRPNYVRTWLGWVDRETWELKQAQRAKRKEAERDQHKFHRTTKAKYKWMFFDPTWELQKRFDDQKKRSYIRLLPSWLRSYPHGTLQSGTSGTLAGQVKAPKGIYQFQFPDHQSSTHSRLSQSESLGNAQFDGYPTSGAARDPHPLPDPPMIKRSDAVMPRSPGKSCLLPQVPILDESRVIQVWRVRETPLPERLGRPRRESEEELSGVVEPQETLIRRDTQHRLRMGRPHERMDELNTEARVGTHVIPIIFDLPNVRYPRAYSRRPMEYPTVPEAGSFAARRIRYIGGLERRVQAVRTDPTLMLIHGTLDSLMREIRRAGGTRHRQRPIIGNRQAPIASRPPVQDSPVPENVLQANRLRQYIEDLERRIHDIRTEPTLTPIRGTLDGLMHELCSARATRERLGPIASLRPAVPAAQHQPQNIQANPLPTSDQDTAVAIEPGPTAQPEMWRFGMTQVPETTPDTAEDLDSMDRLERLATNNFQNHLRDLQNGSDVLDVQAFTRAVNAFINLFEGITMTRANLVSAASVGPAGQRLFRHIQNTNASSPTIVTPRAHAEPNRAVIEDPATDDDDSLSPNSEEENQEGDRALTEGPETDDNSGLNPASEEGNRPPTHNPVAAMLLRSRPDHDPTLNQADPTAQHDLEPEEVIRAEATQANATPLLISQELEDALNEELYTDAYP